MGSKVMLIDAMVIDEVRDTLGDDTFRSFVARMIAEVAETQTALLQLYAGKDFETLARTAHRTSGSAASIGASGLHAALKEIENVARTGTESGRLPSLIAALPDLADRTKAALLAALPG